MAAGRRLAQARVSEPLRYARASDTFSPPSRQVGSSLRQCMLLPSNKLLSRSISHSSLPANGPRALDGDFPRPVALHWLLLVQMRTILQTSPASSERTTPTGMGSRISAILRSERFEVIFLAAIATEGEHFCNRLGHIESPFQRRIEALCFLHS